MGNQARCGRVTVVLSPLTRAQHPGGVLEPIRPRDVVDGTPCRPQTGGHPPLEGWLGNSNSVIGVVGAGVVVVVVVPLSGGEAVGGNVGRKVGTLVVRVEFAGVAESVSVSNMILMDSGEDKRRLREILLG